jgi:hypothetical protein
MSRKLAKPEDNGNGVQGYEPKPTNSKHADNTYNGWKNRATWNVSLWLNNEYAIYMGAVEFMKDYTGKRPYIDFCKDSGLDTQRTPDRIMWISDQLDYAELNLMMWELAPEGARKLG